MLPQATLTFSKASQFAASPDPRIRQALARNPSIPGSVTGQLADDADEATGLRLVLIIAAAAWLLRRLMMKQIQGTTGDTAGAMVELIETICLVALAL